MHPLHINASLIFAFFFPPDKHTRSNAHYCTHNAETRHCEATHGQRGRVEWSRGEEATTRERDVTKQTDQTKMNADFFLFFRHRRSEKKTSRYSCVRRVLTCCCLFSGGKCNYLAAAGVINELYSQLEAVQYEY